MYNIQRDKILFVANLIKVIVKSIERKLWYLVKLLGYPVKVHYVLQIHMAVLRNKHKENEKNNCNLKHNQSDSN